MARKRVEEKKMPVLEGAQSRKSGRGPATVETYRLLLRGTEVIELSTQGTSKLYCSAKSIGDALRKQYGVAIYNRFMSNLARDHYKAERILGIQVIDFEDPMSVSSSSVVLELCRS